MQVELPQPSAAALEHSAALARHIRADIAAAGGWLSFAEYMRLALYAPGLGYYSAGARKLGAAGDFVTAPEISPLFSRCLATQCAEVLAGLGGGVVLEVGAGTGVMAADLLLELERQQRLPDEYLILEPSPDLRERQRILLAERAPHLTDRLRWLETGPPVPVRGVVVANEVLDALPVNRFLLQGERIDELGVEVADDAFSYSARPARADLLDAIRAIPELATPAVDTPYVSELSMQLPAWIKAASGWLERGIMLLFDYGYPRREYYLPERSSGTLRCYYRHRAHEDPFLWPGLQDITAWVDFSRVAESARTVGLDVAGYTTQANFLLAAGIDSFVEESAGDPVRQLELARGLRTLLLPGEMGEAIKVVALSRGGVAAPTAMQGRDLRSRL